MTASAGVRPAPHKARRHAPARPPIAASPPDAAVQAQRSPARRLWALFSSVRTALVLILLLAGTSLVGALLVQAPGSIVPGSDAYETWLLRVQPRYGMWADVFSVLGLFTVFRVWWFHLLVVALALNILVCSVNRWSTLSREVFRPRIRLADQFFERSGAARVDSAADARATADALRSGLTARHFRVLTEDDGATVHLFADRHRIPRFGSLLAHLSIVLLLVAVLGSAIFGASDDGFLVPEGTTRDVGFGTGLSVRADSFVDEYYPAGQPKDYRSDLVLFDRGTEVARKTVRVNDPLEYDGVRFYQSFFGPAAYFRVDDRAGRLLFEDGVALAWLTTGDRSAGSFVLPGQDLTVYAVGPSSNGRDSLVKPGEMRLELYRGSGTTPVAMQTVAQGQPAEIAGMQFTFVGERQFTGLRVARDPMVPLIWVACALFVVGVAAVFWFPYRRLWAVVAPRPGGGSRVTLATAGTRNAAAVEDVTQVADELRAAAAAPVR